MSIKLWYLIVCGATCLFLLVYAAWAVVAASNGAGAFFFLHAIAALIVVFLLIVHAVSIYRRTIGIAWL